MKQKDVFLSSEGDAWFLRNHVASQSRDFEVDQIVSEIRTISKAHTNLPNAEELKILEIGCGEGRRLAWLKAKLGATVCGLEPSSKAVEVAVAQGVDAVQGTADDLPFGEAEFEVIIFGFCLYLCDVDDLFKIASEAHRVLRKSGWVVIQDFYAPASVRRNYHHKPGIYSHKMDYKTLFDWHPDYTCYVHDVRHHSTSEYTDDTSEWVATTVLRKFARPND